MTELSRNGILFIVNPISGNGKALKTEKLIRKVCRKNGKICSIQRTGNPGDATTLARKGLAAGFEAIVAVGGDGTVNEVGKELVGSQTPLGIIPSGSGNGLARHMKIPMNARRALKRILSDRKRVIDTGLLNKRVFLNVAGIGFDARVSHAFSKSKKRGWFNYLKIILRLGGQKEYLDVEMTVNGKERNCKVMMISFANSAQFGNNAKIAPKAVIDDGLIDVCILYPIGFLRSIYFMLKMMTGTVRNSSYFETFKTETFSMKGSGGKAHLDGDAIKTSTEVMVQINPKSLHILC